MLFLKSRPALKSTIVVEKKNNSQQTFKWWYFVKQNRTNQGMVRFYLYYLYSEFNSIKLTLILLVYIYTQTLTNFSISESN